MSDNRELKLTVVVDDSNLKDFRQQLLEWKKDFPKGAKATSGKITTAFEEIADAAKSSNAAIRSLVTENSSTLSKMSTALDSVTTAMVGVQAAFDRFEKLGGKMKAITDAVTTVQGASKQLEADLKSVPERVESELAKVATAVKGRAKKLKDDLAAQKPAEIKVAAEFDAEKLLKPLQGIKSEISKLGTKIKNLKISPKLDAKPVTAGLKQIQEQLAVLSTVQKPIALNLDFEPLLTGLNRIEGSIGQLATSLAEQSERFAQAGKKSGEAFGGQLKQETEEAAKQAATNAQKILNARFLAKGATAQLTETLQAQLAAAQGVNPEALTRRFSSFAIGDSLNFKAYMDSLDLQTKQLQAKVAQIMKAAVVAPYTYAGAEWWDKALAEKDAGIKAYFASLDPDTKQLQTLVKQVMKSAVVAPYEYAGSEWWEQILAEKDAGVRAYFDSLNPDTKKLDSKVRQVMKAAVVAPYTYAGAEWWEKALSEKEVGVKAYFESLDPDTKQLQNKVKQVMKAAVVAPYTYAGAEWWEKVMAEQAAGAQKIVQQYNQIAATTQAARNRMLKVVSSADGGDAATFAMVNPGARMRDKFELQEMAEFYRSGQSGGEALGLGPATEEVKKFNQVTGSSLTSNAAFKKSLDDMKFAARGVASGFNAMWLTWGNVGPLLAGAAISNAFVEAVKQGAALSGQLEFITVLGGESAESVSLLREELIRLGNTGLFGPQQVAEAMRALSLAGVDAQTATRVMGDVVNLATVGSLDLKVAAESLVGIGNAFGLASDGFGRVGDVISKSAAISQTSVESITESMKQASVVAQRYGVSLEDTASALTVLGKLNITGTAAGTAFRNMITNITGQSREARIALEQLKKKGFDPFKEDNTGKLKPMVDLIKDLSGALEGLDAKNYDQVIKTLTTERGDKALSALITSFQKVVTVGGQAMRELDFILMETTESYGFQAIAAARLATTTENEFKRVKAAVQTSLVDAFDKAEPRINAIAVQLRQVFGSEEFKQAVADLTVSFARATQFVLEHREAIKNLVIGYIAFKSATVTAGLFSGFGVAIKSATEAVVLKTAALNGMSLASLKTAANLNVAGVAVTGLAGKAVLLSRVVGAALGPIGLALSVGATLWTLYADKSGDALTELDNHAKNKGKSMLEYMDGEIERMERQIKVLDELKTKKLEVYDTDTVLKIVEVQDATDAKLKLINDSARERSAKFVGDSPQNVKTRAQIEEARLLTEEAIFKEEDRLRSELMERSKRLSELSKQIAGKTKNTDVTVRGTEEFPLDPGNGLSGLKSAYGQIEQIEKASAENEKKILEAKFKGKLIAEESYLAELKRIKAEEQDALLQNNDDQVALARNNLKGEQLKQELKALAQKRELLIDNAKTELQVAELEGVGQRNLANLKLDKDLRTTSLQVTNELAKAQAEFNAVAVAPEVAAAQAARLKVEQDFSKILSERQTEQEKFQEELLILQKQEGEFDQKAADSLNAKIAGKQVEIDKIRETTEALAIQAEQQARNNELLKKDPIRNVQKAVNEYYNELNNLGTVANNVAKQSLQKLEDAFTEFVQTGKFSASALFDTLKAEMARFLAKQYIMRPITVLVNAVLGGVSLGGLFGGAGMANAAGGFDGSVGDAGVGSFQSLASTVSGVKSVTDSVSLLSKIPTLLSGGITGLEAAVYNGFARAGAQLGITGTKNIALANTGTALAGAGIAYGGYQLGRGISNGYSLNGGSGNGTVNTGATVGAILGSAAGPFGAAVGAALGSIAGGTINRLFGRKRINGASGVEGTFDQFGLSNARGFQDVTLKGGLFRSSKSFTEYFGIDTKAIEAINSAFLDARRAVELASNALRVDFTRGLANLNLSGRIGGDLQAVLNNATDSLVKEIIKVSAGVGDDFLEFLESIKEESEKLVDTFNRVAKGVSLANNALLSLGQAAQFSVQSVESALGLLASIGDNGLQLLDQFVENFVPVREQFARQSAVFQQTVRELGLSSKVSINTTREEFRKLVESLDLTTASGQRELSLLLQIMPQLDSLIKRREQEALAVDELSLSIGNLILQVGNQAVEAIDKQISLSKDAADQAREAASAYRLLNKSLSDSARNVLGLTRQDQTGSLRQQFDSSFALASTGDKDALERLGSDASQYLESFKNSASTSLQFTLEAIKVSNKLNQAASVADVLATGSDFQAKLFDVQTAALEVVKEHLQTGNITVETLQEHTKLLENIGQQIANSAQLTVGATEDATGQTVGALFDFSGRVVGQLATDTVLNIKALSNQTGILTSQSEATTSLLVNVLGQSSTKLVEALDADRNGVISALEVQNANSINQQSALFSLLITAFGDSSSKSAQSIVASLSGKASTADISELIRSVDVNRDGVITAQEVSTAKVIASAGSNALSQISAVFSSGSNQAAYLASMFGNTVTGQTASLGALTQDQINRLQVLNNTQSRALSLTDIVARSTDASETLLSAVLDRLAQQDSGSANIVASLNLGNSQIISQLAQVVAAVQQQSVAQAAEVERQKQLAQAQQKLEEINSQRNSLISFVKSAVDQTYALAAKYGVFLSKDSSELANSGKLGVNSEGLLDYNFQIVDPGGDAGSGFTGFIDELYKTSGLYGATKGNQASLSILKNQLQAQRDLIISLGGIPQFAKGGVFTNGIVSQPTMFNMAEMGERGPEAIMPLTRGPNGLGVRMMGGDSGYSKEMAMELKMLREEVKQLRAENRIGMATIAQGTTKTANLLDDVTNGNERFITVVEPM